MSHMCSGVLTAAPTDVVRFSEKAVNFEYRSRAEKSRQVTVDRVGTASFKTTGHFVPPSHASYAHLRSKVTSPLTTFWTVPRWGYAPVASMTPTQAASGGHRRTRRCYRGAKVL